MDKIAKPADAPENKVDTPENKADPKKSDHSAIGTAMKAASVPAAAVTGFWVMDSTARGHIMDTERKASPVLQKAFAKYETRRNRLSRAAEIGMDPAIALAKREANHTEWRNTLYANLEKKGFMTGRGQFNYIETFRNKFRHLRRVDKQQAIVEGMTVAGIILGAVFAIANSQFFHKPQDKDDSPAR